ncbi:MAG: hypothetical protein QOH35_2389 [Acidobacteriaceae bacterium]|jgi:hypothetical protein|nr:hypothetical protein [Acidobacteriaceae bacterium]
MASGYRGEKRDERLSRRPLRFVENSFPGLGSQTRVSGRWIDPNLRNARVSGSHRSDALYQGTTLVGP